LPRMLYSETCKENEDKFVSKKPHEQLKSVVKCLHAFCYFSFILYSLFLATA
jgi:hypothetical protein